MQESAEGGDNAAVTEVPFELRGFSLATVALVLGGIITVGSLGEVGGCVRQGRLPMAIDGRGGLV